MIPFSAWHLPPGFSLDPAETRLVAGGPFPPFRWGSLSRERIRELMGILRAAREEGLASLPVEEVVAAVDRVARRLLDPGDDLRREVLTWLGPQAGFSTPMAARVLEGMARDWTRDRLMSLLEAEFTDFRVLDGFRPRAQGGAVRALGFPLSFHLGAGSVPGVATTSLIRALLVKSAVLLKPGGGDLVLPVVFCRGLAAEHPELARSVAVAYWPPSEITPTEAALQEADLVVVYGGDDTVRWVRDRLPVTTPLRAYRHRLGVGLVGREALGAGAEEAARDAARAVSLFDQRGCVSPHVLLVEEGGPVSPGEWGEHLARALEALEEELPSGPLTPEEGVAIQHLRAVGEMDQVEGGGAEIRHGGSRAPWTVCFHPGGDLTPSCLNRVVTILPVAELGEAPGLLQAWAGHLQTVGVAGLGDREGALREALARLGVSRVAPLAEVPWPPPWWHHDGSGPLRALTHWTDWEVGEGG